MAQSPVISQPPIPQTVFFGDPATFQVSATGSAPLTYQWYRNGSPIGGGTDSALLLAAVTGADHQASFSVRVTNVLGSVFSSAATLTVDFGVPGAPLTNRVLNYNSVWRFNQSNNLDAVNWTAPGYSDSGWQSGPGLIAAESNGAITPLIGTSVIAPLTPPPGLASGHAYYFRTAINYTNTIIPAGLLATMRVDDGAMIYVNSAEALRLRIAPGPVTNLTFTTGFPPDGTDATIDEILPLNVLQLNDGNNLIAVSVHQQSASSSDMVWGMALDVVGYERLRDYTSPWIVSAIPDLWSTVPVLTSIEMHFNEGVKGVDASDLLINGVPATNVIAYAPDVYLFQFPPPPTGNVDVAWSSSTGIVDLSANSNVFWGGSYYYNVDPGAVGAEIQISEFMAGNDSTIRDNDGEFSDWIELYNAGGQSRNLGGWYLTDNASNLTKWRFPNGLVLPPNTFLLVWASSKNRTNLAAPLHTNFKLGKSANTFLGLVYADGATVISSFTYPAQFDDVSYGRDRLDPSIVGYFTNATPGTYNADVGANFAPPVKFSKASSTFLNPFTLTLSTGATNTVIRYFLVTNTVSAALTNVPDTSSPVYTTPLTISASTEVRARAFSTQPNIFPSAPTTETYLRITAPAATFSSDVPIVLFYNFSGGTPPATADQNAVMMVFGTDYGRASMNNPPDLVTRIGLNIRGSSSEGFNKKSFAVELWDEHNNDKKLEILGLPEESDWVFYAPNFFDKPFIHNPLMHQLSRDIGRYSSRTRMIEVFTCFNSNLVNYASPTVGNYNGIYVLEEKIKAGNSRVDVPRLDPTETNAPAITGGYVLKIDRMDADERYIGAANAGMVYVEPQMKDYSLYPGRALQESYIANYFNSFYAALTGPNWTNPVTGYAAWIDVDAWVDHHILNVLSLNADAMRLSGYFFKDRNKKIEMGPLWDFDRGLGTSDGSDWRAWNPRSWISSNPLGSPTSTDWGTDYFNPNSVFSNPWYSRIVKDPDFWQKWIDRWQQLRRKEFTTNSIFRDIEIMTNQIRLAQSREIAKWGESQPRSGFYAPPAGWPDTSYSFNFPAFGTYAGEIAFLKRWLADRLDFIDTNFLAQPTLSRTGGLVSVGQTITLTPAAEPGSYVLFTLDGRDPRLPGGGILPAPLFSTTPITLPVTNNIRLFARSWNNSHHNLSGTNNPPISSPWSGPVVESFYTALPSLRVTEIMYNPPPAPLGNTNDSDNFEYIELKNIGATPLNLLNFRLCGGIDFLFPSLTLTGGQYVVVAKNLAAFRSRYGNSPLVAGVYTNNLGNGGDHIVLQGPLQELILDFTFQDSWYPSTDGEGFSLVNVNPLAATDTWSLKSSWRPSGSTNGSPAAADTPANISGILVTEALTHTDPPLMDTVELFNPTLATVDLSGWFLTDDAHDPKKFRIAPGTSIAAGNFLTFNANQFGVGPKAFSFNSTGDAIYLYSGDVNTNLTGYAHGFEFGAAPNPVSFGRYVNSQGDEHFVLQSINTLGTANAYPRVGPIVISEIMYHPPDLFGGEDDSLNEFIELQNITATNVPLYDVNVPTNTWRLRGGVDFDFPTNPVLAAGARLLVVSFNPTIYAATRVAFIGKYGVPGGVPILGPWSGKLDNSGETIQLERPDNPNVTPTNTIVPYYLVDKVSYTDTPPWPTAADGTGASLQRIQSTLYGNDPMNWQAATPTAGQPNPSGPMVDADHDGLADIWELVNGLDPQIASGTNGASADNDGDGANNLHEYIAGTNPNNAADFLHFTSAFVENQTCKLEFNSRTGRTYSVEYVNTLGPSLVWNTLASGIAGTGGTATVNDPQSTETRYYRLKVTLNP